ncbi:DUF4080 domain-containing protein [Granulosicoccaceae sp. 1_MG-2023]|nr:DUF4080 domain-containing protein [Granulosicoccaceae sp. 1_MG-2023]
MPAILLSTLNARYIHASLGLRYLLANMDELRERTALREFTINQRTDVIAEAILADAPEVLGLGVYIWNVRETASLVATLKTLRPQMQIVLGGPEVSFETEQQQLTALADYVITGQADLAFARLCRELLAGRRPAQKIIPAHPEPLPFLKLPYHEYSDEDLRQRVIYVEASRGCPFKCEFCLSALDKTATPFDQSAFLAAMQSLYERGARHFKFVDRTFNLKIQNSLQILNFFLEKLAETPLFLHFELIPDRLPEALRETLKRFPPGSLQFEIGVQSFTPEVQALISRKQDNDKTCENLCWLREHTHAHIHADLIFGLPGETLQSFADSFDKLYALRPHEIQLGILKRLRGTPIDRHTGPFGMRYHPEPPYPILMNDRISFPLLQRVSRLARYWDMIGNSGRFERATALIAGDRPFARFLTLSDFIYETSGQTHKISLRNLFALVWQGLTGPLQVAPDVATAALAADFADAGQKGVFTPPQTQTDSRSPAALDAAGRQRRHRS